MLRPIMNRNNQIISSETGYVSSVGDKVSIKCDTPAYAYARLHNWKDTKELKVLLDSDVFLTEGGLDLIKTMANLHDNDITPNSQIEKGNN